jgi:DNA-binding NarL/FixJ family response regulator
MRTVIILDDHRLFSNGLVLMLAGVGMELDLHVFDDRSVALAAKQSSPPHLLIVDLYIPGVNAPELIRQVRLDHPDCRIMVVSASINPVDRRQALEAGAEIFFSKSSDPAALLEAVRSLLEGGTPSASGVIGAELAARFDLTVRRLEVLALVSKGCSNKEIARMLGLSPETVKSHLHQIFTRLPLNVDPMAVSASAVLLRSQSLDRQKVELPTLSRWRPGGSIGICQRDRHLVPDRPYGRALLRLPGSVASIR